MSQTTFDDVLYTEKEGVATITVNRPERMNAYRIRTYSEVTEAILHAGWDPHIGVVVLTGAGTRRYR